MQPDIIIKTLKIGVDPADSSYMPSVIIVSGGTSSSSLEELNAVYVRHIDTSVTILSNMARVLNWHELFALLLICKTFYSIIPLSKSIYSSVRMLESIVKFTVYLSLVTKIPVIMS